MSLFSDALSWIYSLRRERALDNREATKSLASELDSLADLMSDVLAVTAANGRIQQDKLPELELLRQRVWNRWVSILGTRGYASQDPGLQTDIENCIRIAHDAPGSFVEEVYLAQIGIAEGHLPTDVRVRFARSIDKLRDLTSRMRLNA
jgi:hypothetical protein